MQSTLYYIHDPMCSWCWGFDPVLQKLLNTLPTDLHVKRILGGLAADNEQAMPQATRDFVKNNWLQIQQQIPGTQFNFDFWTQCQPRRSTYPACRAVLAAREQHDKYDAGMTKAIQQAYYLHAQNPSDDETLINLAQQLKLDISQFSKQLNSAKIQRQLHTEITFSRNLPIQGFPSLIYKNKHNTYAIPINYRHHATMLKRIQKYHAENNSALNSNAYG